jgi:hypothetical protein
MTLPPLLDHRSLSIADIVDRMAKQHHELTNDPWVRLFGPKLREGPTWAELLEAGYRALKEVGEEIARARTEAESAAATLRQNKYAEAMERMENTLLQVAVRQLAKGPIMDGERGRYVGLVGLGHRNLSADFEPIPMLRWEAGTMDWSRRQLRVHDETWSGIKIWNLADLPPELARVAAAIINPELDDARSNVTGSKLAEFLSKQVERLDPGSPELTHDRLWEAAQRHFPDNKIPRQMLRDWIDKHMPADKKRSPGRAPARQS